MASLEATRAAAAAGYSLGKVPPTHAGTGVRCERRAVLPPGANAAYMLGLVRKVTPGHCFLQSRESRETLREVLKPLAKTLVALAFPPVFPRRLGTEPVAEQGYPSCE